MHDIDPVVPRLIFAADSVGKYPGPGTKNLHFDGRELFLEGIGELFGLRNRDRRIPNEPPFLLCLSDQLKIPHLGLCERAKSKKYKNGKSPEFDFHLDSNRQKTVQQRFDVKIEQIDDEAQVKTPSAVPAEFSRQS